jgi:hypothetical protein
MIFNEPARNRSIATACAGESCFKNYLHLWQRAEPTPVPSALHDTTRPIVGDELLSQGDERFARSLILDGEERFDQDESFLHARIVLAAGLGRWLACLIATRILQFAFKRDDIVTRERL